MFSKKCFCKENISKIVRPSSFGRSECKWVKCCGKITKYLKDICFYQDGRQLSIKYFCEFVSFEVFAFVLDNQSYQQMGYQEILPTSFVMSSREQSSSLAWYHTWGVGSQRHLVGILITIRHNCLHYKIEIKEKFWPAISRDIHKVALHVDNEYNYS